MHMATLTTSLARVGLVDNDHSAPWVLTGLVQQALFEPIVRPGDHGSGRLGSDATLASPDHLGCFEWWQ